MNIVFYFGTRKEVVIGGLDVYGIEKIADVADFFNNVKQFYQVKVVLADLFRGEIVKYDIDFY